MIKKFITLNLSEFNKEGFNLNLIYVPHIIKYHTKISFISQVYNLPTNVFFTKWFTKNSNAQKLFVYTKLGFLSSGLVLRFAKLDKKFLKKTMRMWILTLTFFKKLFFLPVVIWYQNLFNQKFKLLTKKFTLKINMVWVFIKLFYLNFIFVKKKKKSIKKWIYKKQYRYFDN